MIQGLILTWGSPCACVGFLSVLWFPPTEKHTHIHCSRFHVDPDQDKALSDDK